MNTKVIVQLVVPEVDMKLDVFLPINKKIGNIVNLLNQSIYELTHGEIVMASTNKLINVHTKEVYNSDVLLFDTDIRNGTVLALIS